MSAGTECCAETRISFGARAGEKKGLGLSVAGPRVALSLRRRAADLSFMTGVNRDIGNYVGLNLLIFSFFSL